jgi:anthranilate synthase component 1
VVGDATDAFWLDSGADGTSYLGVGVPVALPAVGGVLDALRAELAGEPPDADDDAPAFRLGLVGWLGYELRSETMGVDATRASRYPVASFLRVTRAVAVTASGEASLLALGNAWEGELASWRDAIATLIARIGGVPTEKPRTNGQSPEGERTTRWRDTRDEYIAKIAACQDAIREGEAYQLCLTSEVEVTGDFNPLDTYLTLRAASPTHHGALVRIGGVSLLSSSPERFLEVDPDGAVRTHPIKGTRPRSLDPELDARLSDELLGSEKERAENVMIVDLMRNDLARVSEVGSVTVPSLLDVESYAQVHQLVSTVQGRLRAGLTGIDAIAACFPAGSMTGAPKQRATEILDRLEGRARGLYAGAFGYLGFDGRVDLAMTIRSIVLDEVGATVGAGGVITALSVPSEEWDEAQLKAAALLRALGAWAG